MNLIFQDVKEIKENSKSLTPENINVGKKKKQVVLRDLQETKNTCEKVYSANPASVYCFYTKITKYQSLKDVFGTLAFKCIDSYFQS